MDIRSQGVEIDDAVAYSRPVVKGVLGVVSAAILSGLEPSWPMSPALICTAPYPRFADSIYLFQRKAPRIPSAVLSHHTFLGSRSRSLVHVHTAHAALVRFVAPYT